jgi:DNA-binding Lrp family transcriptional regulator
MVLPFYMMLRTRIGKSRSVVHAALKIEGVKVAHSVMGNYDVILYAEGKDLEDLRRIRLAIENINGITATESAIHA